MANALKKAQTKRLEQGEMGWGEKGLCVRDLSEHASGPSDLHWRGQQLLATFPSALTGMWALL